jgi:hypothetical protein
MYWCQYAFQYSHEFCHALTNPLVDVLGNKGWFEEVICEIASAFTLNRMSLVWQTNPPYPNWITFASSLSQYIDDYKNSHRLPTGRSINDFYKANYSELEINRNNRATNAVIAYRVPLKIPVFKENLTLLDKEA